MESNKFLTLLIPVKQGHQEKLSEFLTSQQWEFYRTNTSILSEPGVIHFCRFVLMDPVPAENIPCRLVFTCNADVGDRELLTKMSEKCTPLMDDIFSHCEGYPLPEDRNTENRLKYLLPFSQKNDVVYAGAPGHSLKNVLREMELATEIRKFIGTQNFEGLTSTSIVQRIRKHIESTGRFEWVNEPVTIPKINYINLALFFILLLIASPLLILWILIIHFRYERTEKVFDLQPGQVDEKHMEQVEMYEDYIFQNPFSQLVPMKQQWMRRVTYRLMMLVANVLVPYLFVKGKIMGIPTIHFARWVSIDGGRRVMFFSNIDGSWQQYLGDFIDKSGWGLTGIWTNSILFPRTKFLVSGGAYRSTEFFAWSRYYQIPTQFWYTAYPNLSIKNVTTNRYIHSCLQRELNEEQATELLNRI